MIDRYLLPAQRALLVGPARILAARGVTADQVTIAGFCIGLTAIAALSAGWFGIALVLILANRVADGLDGAIAREVGPTDRGAFLDIALDFVFYALVPVGFALADPAANGLASAVLIASFVGTGSSFLAFASVAAKRQLSAEAYPTKGIYYLGGLTEGAETIALFTAMCVWPGAFQALAWTFAALCTITTLTRWYQGWTTFATRA